jgi:hypothetical protein
MSGGVRHSDEGGTMGEFMALSGVSKASRRDVLQALEEFALAKNGKLAPAPGGQPFDHLIVAGEDFGPITVMYPDGFIRWGEASTHLSETLGVPVLSLHVHDGDLWMYVLYRDGEEIDQFNPIPDYWSEDVSDEERSSWKGDAIVVAEVWDDVDAGAIEKYLVTWDLDDDEPGKAYETDQHPIGDCWQIVDFMSKLGLTYPVDDQGRVMGETYTFDLPSEG